MQYRTMKKTFIEQIKAKWAENKYVSVGLDPVWEKIPEHLRNGKSYGDPRVLFQFCREIIDATKDLVNSYKPNSAFFEAYGPQGIEALKDVCDHIHNTTEVPIILDFKRGDIGSTNEGYVTFAFEYLQADAVTVHPWLGKEAMKPFLDRKEKGIIVLCKTSNEGSDQFQNLMTDQKVPLYMHVAKTVNEDWNTNGNCMLVVGATYPAELQAVRATVPHLGILVPGIGAQGGDIEAALNAGLITGSKDGLIINSSRGIIYASASIDFAIAAREETSKLNEHIILCLEKR